MIQEYDNFDWERFFVPYRQTVKELDLKFRILIDSYATLNEYCPIYRVLGRVKTPASILDKASSESYAIDELASNMQDIAGIRLITQFEGDIYVIVEMIKSRTDMNIIKTKDYLANPKQSGYKSVHLIVEYDVNSIYGFQKTLCEIQIRTLAMDFWASIEHSLNYKYNDEMPEEIKVRLINAAESIGHIDTEMGNIKEEIKAAQKIYRKKTSVNNDIVDGLNALSRYGKKDRTKKYYKFYEQLVKDGDLLQLSLMQKEIEEEINELMKAEREENNGTNYYN